MKHTFKLLLAFILGACLPADTASALKIECEVVYLDVALVAGSDETDSIYAEICSKGNKKSKETPVQILIHGGSYDHRYWNPGWDKDYSYVDYMVKKDYTVINIDRVGVGYSSKPENPMTVDFDVAAYTIHQIVQMVKGDGISTFNFGNVQRDKVVLVGFSFGSMIATMEAATYNDVDGLVLQSYSHTVGPAGLASYNLAYPANNEPKFNGLDTNYFTTLPNVRPELFFYEDNVEPYILHTDELIKQTYSLAELMSIEGSMAASYNVSVPVFLIVGDYDFIACDLPSCTAAGSLVNEHTHFPLAPSFEYEIVEDAGHTLNWHKKPKNIFKAMEKWIKNTF